MHYAQLFIGVAQQHGCSPHAARAVLDAITQQLRVRRLQVAGFQSSTFHLTPFYVYRTGGSGVGGDSGGSGRPRLLMAFPSADSALAFAQHNQLGTTPRLLSMSVPQLLATLVQRASISAILFVDEPAEAPPGGHLPPGLRLERITLLEMLKEE